MKQYVNLRGKRLVFSVCATTPIPLGADGLIFPHDNGLIITDEQGIERLFIEHDDATGICWFLNVGKRGARRWFEPTNDTVLLSFGLKNLTYDATLILAQRIFQQCKKYLSARKRDHIPTLTPIR